MAMETQQELEKSLADAKLLLSLIAGCAHIARVRAARHEVKAAEAALAGDVETQTAELAAANAARQEYYAEMAADGAAEAA